MRGCQKCACSKLDTKSRAILFTLHQREYIEGLDTCALPLNDNHQQLLLRVHLTSNRPFVCVCVVSMTVASKEDSS